MNKKRFYIKGNVPSSKNSKIITRDKRIINSATVRKYIKEYGKQWEDEDLIQNFKSTVASKEKPYKLHFYFIRDSKRKFDYINAAQLPCDLMTKYGWIDDDNCDEIVPVFDGYEVDKKNAGLIFWVDDTA